MSAKILLVEDNAHYMEINKTALVKHGYTIYEATNLSDGRKLFLEHAPDLIVLDIMLPDGNGLLLCEELREGSQVPILFVSAKKEDDDVMAGFDVGGDDYLTKPYSLGVLLKRVEAVLSRTRQVPDKLIKGLLVLNLLSNEVLFDNTKLDINKGREFDVLFFLAKREGQIFTAEQIYEQVWGQPMVGDDNPIRKTISALRKKLEVAGYTITNEQGKGYVFEVG